MIKTKIETSLEKIDQILERGVIADILPLKETFREELLSGRQLKMYLGIDPTATSLHLGHAQNIMLLEDFRRLGHAVTLLIGDFTARIGDPSAQDTARKPLSSKEINKNIESIANQISPLIGIDDKNNPAQIDYNSSWLEKLSFGNILELASNFTAQQMLERDMFQERIKNRKPIFLQEFLYPLMQAYDSVALDTDVEIGGTDQTFNMLAGRTLLKKLKNKEKFVVTINLVENPKTGELMSKSRGTGVFLGSSVKKMFGEIMAQPDEMINVLFISNTRLPLEKIKDLTKKAGAGGKKTRDVKMRLAEEITSIYHSKKEVKKAKDDFIKTFSKGEPPQNIKTKTHPKNPDILLNIVADSGLIDSKTEARRLIDDGAVEIDGQIIKNQEEVVDLTGKGIVLKVGKHRFLKIKSE